MRDRDATGAIKKDAIRKKKGVKDNDCVLMCSSDSRAKRKTSALTHFNMSHLKENLAVILKPKMSS